jgi:hypothetical protein
VGTFKDGSTFDTCVPVGGRPFSVGRAARTMYVSALLE